MIGRLFSGNPAPLVMFPALFQEISFYLPFQWFFYVPTCLFLSGSEGTESISLNLSSSLNGHNVLWGIPILLGWCFIILSLHRYIWKKGITKYSAAGM